MHGYKIDKKIWLSTDDMANSITSNFGNLLLLGRIILSNIAGTSQVPCSFCLFIGNDRKNGKFNQTAIRGGGLGRPKEHCIRWGPDSPQKWANFFSGDGWHNVTYMRCGLFPNYYGISCYL